MKNEKIDTKGIIRVVFLIVVASVIIFTGRTILASFNKNSYKAYIQVSAVLEDDSTYESLLDVVVDGNKAKVKADFYKGNIYVDEDKVLFDAGSNYKYYESERTIKDLKKIIKKVRLGEPVSKTENGDVYNPELEADVINDILMSLFIYKETKSSAPSQIVMKDDKYESFSLYLVDIDGYKDINITVRFDEFKDSLKFEIPVLYEDIMKKIEPYDIAMIK